MEVMAAAPSLRDSHPQFVLAATGAAFPDPLNRPRLPLPPAGVRPLAPIISPEFRPHSGVLLKPVL